MEKIESFKQKIIKTIFIFLGVILACTIISRTIYTYLLPVVSTTKVKNESVETKTIATGKIGLDETAVKNGQAIVLASISGKVTKVYKKEGEKVKAGEVVCCLKKNTDGENEKASKMEYAQLAQDKESLARKIEAGRRSRQDLTKEYEEKKQELNKVESLTKLISLDESIAEQQKLIQTDKALYEGGFLSEQEYNEAINKLTSLQRDRKEEKKKATEDIEEALKTLDEKIDVLDDSILNLEDQQKVNDKKLALTGEAQLVENVTSPISGYVYTLNVNEGAYVEQNEKLVIILPEELGYSLSFDVEDEAANKLQVGQQVSFLVGQSGKKATIIKKQFNETSGKVKVTADIEEEIIRELALDYKTYKMVSVEAVCSSGSYNYVVANSAIQTVYTNHYVFVVEESEGIGGKSYKVRKVPVTILEEGDYKTAIDGTISAQMSIVSSGLERLSDGAEVALQVGEGL